MPQITCTFRLFVSSTFSDLREERNALYCTLPQPADHGRNSHALMAVNPLILHRSAEAKVNLRVTAQGALPQGGVRAI